MTRTADHATLIVDGSDTLERVLVRNPGTKTSALDVVAALPIKERSLDEPSSGKGRSRNFAMDM